jgi:voltage-gated sodium channel
VALTYGRVTLTSFTALGATQAVRSGTFLEGRAVTLRELVDHPRFNGFIVGVIVLNAVLIGAGTYTRDPGLLGVFAAVEWGCVAIFAVEIALRFAARRSTREYFSDGWNIFDIVIVASAFIPASNGLGPALRILRVFRVLRLVKTIPELRLIVSVLVRSVASMKYIGLLALILFYVYAVIGVKLFGGDGHPLQGNFASVHEAAFTLFRILTGDDWTQLRYDLGEHASAGAFTAYQVSWIVIATFILVNLIVGAIINNYQEVQQIEQRRRVDVSDKRLAELVDELQELMRARVQRGDGGAGG